MLGWASLGQVWYYPRMLKDTFCSSPWFHIRKNYDGSYNVCRWANKNAPGFQGTAESVMQFYNGDQMRKLRSELLAGKAPSECESCYYQDQHNKLSGRPRQLLKSGIQFDDFDVGMLASPHYKHFEFSQLNQGLADYYPVDLQIDLGKACNSACIMCTPAASSKLETEYQKLHVIEPDLFSNHTQLPDWTRDQDRVDNFATELATIPGIKYVHFLGGETLYIPSFYQLCESMIKAGTSRDIIVGTTTNGTIYDDRLESLITEFKEFHLGISIETVSTLNDYVRWPSNFEQVKSNLEKFIKLRDRFPGLVLSARITPNIFTIYEFDELAEYLFEQGIIAESCNILYEPKCLRIELLPDDIRSEIVSKLETLVSRRALVKSNIYNVRRQDLWYAVLSNTVIEYLDFMKSFTVPIDADQHRGDLVRFLQAFETLRKNSIINHAPRYTEFLRSHGY